MICGDAEANPSAAGTFRLWAAPAGALRKLLNCMAAGKGGQGRVRGCEGLSLTARMAGIFEESRCGVRREGSRFPRFRRQSGQGSNDFCPACTFLSLVCRHFYLVCPRLSRLSALKFWIFATKTDIFPSARGRARTKAAEPTGFFSATSTATTLIVVTDPVMEGASVSNLEPSQRSIT